MKIKTLLVLFILIYPNLHAQKELKNNKKNTIRIGVFYSLDKNLSSENFSFDIYTGYSANYNKSNYRAGINFEFELDSNLSINSGLNYSNKNFTGTFYCAVCNFIIAPLPQKIKLHFIEIPISGRYYFLSSKVRFLIEAGFINQFPTNSEVVKNKYILSGKLGTGIEYNINESFAIQFTTEYTKGLSNISENSEFKSKILGFRLGIVKRL